MYERDIIMESGRWNNGAAKNLIIKERETFSVGVGRKLIFEIGQISFSTDTLSSVLFLENLATF